LPAFAADVHSALAMRPWPLISRQAHAGSSTSLSTSSHGSLVALDAITDLRQSRRGGRRWQALSMRAFPPMPPHTPHTATGKLHELHHQALELLRYAGQHADGL
jgi:hypothetical protein